MDVTVRVTVRDRAGNAASQTVTVVEKSPLLLGATGQPNDTASTFSTFPGIRYFRDFGQSSGSTLTPHGTGKLALAPANSVPHVSWKGPVEALGPWLNGAARPYYLTWHHEPMGDMAPAVYRAEAGKITQILASHPKRHLILGHGPIVTRYWLDQADGDPVDWWYLGATFYGTDCYNGSSTMYRTSQQMLGPGIAAARRFGVPWMVPEWGIERIGSDASGSGRAQAMRDQIAYARQQPDCLGVAWWNIGGDRITGLEPEQTALRQLLQE
jgi:hypothetical protein